MPWKERDTMSLRLEFVTLAKLPDANIRRLCRRYQISPTTGYKWLKRFDESGAEGLTDLSRRPHRTPRRSPPALERAVVQLRKAHPAWGGRTIRAYLHQHGWTQPPAPSTVTDILRRNHQLETPSNAPQRHWQRFEADAPNELWQMDFKGPISLVQGQCHPFTALDDHSRFSVALQACSDQKTHTVHSSLTQAFRRYGLPQCILMDNGPPWGSDSQHRYTPLIAWLIRLGVRPIHSRPYHPQTLGKEERFHRTLNAEVFRYHRFHNLAQCQRHLDRWRDTYNFHRPHQGIGLQVPARRYRDSPRSFPEPLPPIDYGPDDFVRKVQAQGEVFFRGRVFRIPKAFRGYPVALRPTDTDGLFDVYFCQQRLSQLDLRKPYRRHS